MEASRGFGGLSSVAARASVAQRLGKAAVAPKLGMGEARCGHLVFMAGNILGRKARREAWAARNLDGSRVRRGNDREVEDDVADMWGRAVSITEKRGERPCGVRVLLGRPACWAARKNEGEQLLGHCGRKNRAGQNRGRKKNSLFF